MKVSPDVMEVLKLLLKLSDLDDLGDVALLDLAQDARLEKLERGQTLQAGKCLDRHALLIQADRRKDLNQDAELLEQVINELANTVGAMLLEQWKFEPEFVTVARECEDWTREVDAADYCDIVQVAQLHCVLLGGKQIDAPPLSELPAFRRLHLDAVDPIKLVEDARQEINEIVSLLAV